jgi:nitrate reductase (cytochrome)
VTPGKKIEFYGYPDHKAVVFLRPYIQSPEHPTADFPYVLTTGRVLDQWHSGTMTGRIPELAQASGPARLHLNDQDAYREQIRDGDHLEVQSRFGKITGQVVIDPAVRQGVLFVAFYDAKLLINEVVADHYDPVSRQPEYKVTAVSIRKIKSAV